MVAIRSQRRADLKSTVSMRFESQRTSRNSQENKSYRPLKSHASLRFSSCTNEKRRSCSTCDHTRHIYMHARAPAPFVTCRDSRTLHRVALWIPISADDLAWHWNSVCHNQPRLSLQQQLRQGPRISPDSEKIQQLKDSFSINHALFNGERVLIESVEFLRLTGHVTMPTHPGHSQDCF